MFIFMVVIILVITLAAATVIVARRLGIGYSSDPVQKRMAVGGKGNSSDITKWRSVKINPGLLCCKTASDLVGDIYFAADAPAFPLANCTEKVCRCKYIHLEDRRDGSDRREATEYSVDLFAVHGQEKRGGTDRRSPVF